MMKPTKKIFPLMITACLSGSLFLSACGDKSGTANNTASTNTAATTSTANSGKIAYVNLDTLENNYEYFKTKKAEFEKRQKAMQDEVERLARTFQSELTAFQQKAQAGTLSQSEGEAGQRRLAGMQENLEKRQQSLTEQLMKEQEAFNMELQKRLDDFLGSYNKDKGYDYILSYIKGGNILYAQPSLDITADVIAGMNEADKKNGTSITKDTTK